MPYHMSNLGRFAPVVRPVADIGGYVPQNGDDHEELCYEEPNDFSDPDVWNDHVARAEALTGEANKAVEDWQESNKGVLAKLA